MTINFLAENEFSHEIKGLELIIGKTDWEDTDDESREEAEEEDKTDNTCYGNQIEPLITALTGLDSLRITRQNHFEGDLFDPKFTNESCKKLYFDATIIRQKDFPSICGIFPNLEEIELEAENFYSCNLNLTSLENLKKFEITLNPSEKYHSLLAENKVSENDNILTLTDTQIKNLNFTLNADAFVSHELSYVLDHFGTKYPFRLMPKIKVRVGILMHKVVRSSLKELNTYLPEPNFKQI